MTDIKVGDRVRYTAEGVVDAVSGNEFHVCYKWLSVNNFGESVEILPPEEPNVGSVVLDSDNNAWQHSVLIPTRWLCAQYEDYSVTWEELISNYGPVRVIHNA